jgi:hypothetical protein
MKPRQPCVNRARKKVPPPSSPDEGAAAPPGEEGRRGGGGYVLRIRVRRANVPRNLVLRDCAARLCRETGAARLVLRTMCCDLRRRATCRDTAYCENRVLRKPRAARCRRFHGGCLRPRRLPRPSQHETTGSGQELLPWPSLHGSACGLATQQRLQSPQALLTGRGSARFGPDSGPLPSEPCSRFPGGPCSPFLNKPLGPVPG